MPPRNVNLSEYELLIAEYAGRLRQHDNEVKGRPDRYGADRGVELHIEGARCEMAAAKLIARYWEPVYDIAKLKDIPHDVGGWQVRSTQWADGCLILHPDDADDAQFMLVIDSSPTFIFPGWLTAGEGKQEKWWRTDTGRPAFFVPQRYLHGWD